VKARRVAAGHGEAPVSELVDQNSLHLDYQGLPLLFYRAALPLSSRTLNYAAGIIRGHLKAIGSRWRKLNAGQQALPVLACLRKGETFAARGRVRDRQDHRLAVRERDDGTAGCPRPETARGDPEREEGRSRLCHPRRHADPD